MVASVSVTLNGWLKVYPPLLAKAASQWSPQAQVVSWWKLWLDLP